MERNGNEENRDVIDAREDDAREEDIIKDADADTNDIERTERDSTDAVMASIKSVLSMVEDLAAKVDKISNAQDVITTNARIIDDSYENTVTSEEHMDGVPSLRDFDLSI